MALYWGCGLISNNDILSTAMHIICQNHNHRVNYFLVVTLQIMIAVIMLPPVCAASNEQEISTVQAASGSQYRITLRRLGYADGISLEGISDSYTLYFKLPYLEKVNQAFLNLHYRAPELAGLHSNLRISLNGSARRMVGLYQAGDGHVSVPLEESDLRGRYLAIQLDTAFINSENRCIDERANIGYLRVSPDSGLVFEQALAEPDTVRGYWSMLPDPVTVSLAANLDRELFLAAWRIADLLADSGRRLRFARLPEIGDIVIAGIENKHELPAMRSVSPDGSDANLALMQELVLNDTAETQARQVFLLVRDAEAWSLLRDQWLDLAAYGHYDLVSIKPHNLEGVDIIALGFSALGWSGDLLRNSAAPDWRFNLPKLPEIAGFRPDRLQIEVLTAPALNDDRRSDPLLYAYTDNTLIHVERLQNSKQPQAVTIDIPGDSASFTDVVELAIQRNEPHGDCLAPPLEFPAQIMPNGRLIMKRDGSAPNRLVPMVQSMASGFELVLPREAINTQAIRMLQMLTAFSDGLGLNLEFARISGTARSGNRPFLLWGNTDYGEIEAPIRFEASRTVITRSDGAVLLDVDALPGIGVMQVATWNGRKGIWIRPGDSGTIPVPERMHKIQGDVAFFDDRDVILDFDSRDYDISRITYPETRQWLDLFGRYRYWLAGIALILLGLVFLALYRKSISRG